MLRTLMVLAVLASQAAAQETQVEADEAVIVQAMPNSSSAAGYFALTNHGATPIRLTGVEISGMTSMLHETTTDEDGIARMRMRAGFDVVPGETLRFERGGRHVMFSEMDTALTPGQTVEGRLRLADGSTVSVLFEVVDLASMARGMDHGTDHK